jgi:hypothetical protein
MDVFLVIAQGAGLAAACGVRPFLPVLVAGALARADRGVDFDGTAFAFLEAPVFLLAAAITLVALALGERLRAAPAMGPGPVAAAVGGVGIGLGALEFAGSLADQGHPVWPGLVGGLACAALAQAASRDFFARVAARLDEQARGALALYADGLALALGVIAILLPPLSVVALAGFGLMLVRGRRREERKYAGLRILR